MVKKNITQGFTLAEVLITLGVIGIVAALTIPSLINNSQKTQEEAAIKKAYAIWSEALNQMAEDAGCPGDLSCFFNTTNINTIGDKIAGYFNIAKNCDTTQTGCWADANSLYTDGSSPTTGNDTTGTYYKFITADGMAARFYNINQNCVGTSNNVTEACMLYVYIDTNALKGPNRYGRDIFPFMIINDDGPAFYPWGGPKLIYWKDNARCNVGYNGGTDNYGFYCSGRVMDDSWQINY